MRTSTAVALGSAGAGALLILGGGAEFMRYSSWGDPGAPGIGLRLILLGFLVLCVPGVMFLAWVARSAAAEARQLGVTPRQAAVGALVAAEVVQHEWARHNERVDARLTESVMGPVRY